jgi:hypothetical protein
MAFKEARMTTWISQSELLELTGLSRSAISYARMGYDQITNGKVYHYPTWLKKGTDWRKDEAGRVWYSQNAVNKILARMQSHSWERAR